MPSKAKNTRKAFGALNSAQPPKVKKSLGKHHSRHELTQHNPEVKGEIENWKSPMRHPVKNRKALVVVGGGGGRGEGIKPSSHTCPNLGG